MENSSGRSIRKIVSVIIVILMLVAFTSLLMPTLHSQKMASRLAKLQRGEYYDSNIPPEMPAGSSPAAQAGETNRRRRILAHVKTFKAEIDLTPKLSVGTARPESIYEARFHALITAIDPDPAKGECELQLPLPPQLISLSDLTVTINGDPNESVFVESDRLIWRGHLDKQTPIKIEIKYTAMGRGIYTLAPPPGKIVDLFEAKLTAYQSDIRMMKLSLQPKSFQRDSEKTCYTWNYKRLMFGRPIVLDVLGIAPEDRLGELGWLGPISVLVFGLLVSLVGLAYRPELLDKWMLLLLLGTFAGGYPLMYFAQDFLPLWWAMGSAVAVVLAIIAVRAVTLFGLRVGILGAVVLAGAVQALTLGATIHQEMQGVLLTAMAILTLVVAMILLPKAQKSLVGEKAAEPPLLPNQDSTSGTSE